MKTVLPLALVLICTPVLAQLTAEPPPQPGAAASAPATVVERPAITQPSTGPAPLTTLPSAESVLQDLLKQKSPEFTVPSATGPATAPAAVAGAPAFEMNGSLIREGQLVTQRSGHLVKDPAGHLMFLFDDVKPALQAMGVIPSGRLAVMEDASDGGAKVVRFTIDAKVTEYRGKNYLYVQPTGGPPPMAAEAVAGSVVMPETEAVGPKAPAVQRLRELDRVIGRAGRYVKDEKTGAPMFVFDSDGKQMEDPPMGLVPCRALATMEELSGGAAAAGNTVRFIVSGEVTQYRGKNFMWVQNVRSIRDLHQGIGP